MDIAYKSGGMVRHAGDLHNIPGVEILSFDHGITHARITNNGMKIAIVPFGKGGTVMMRRLVEGGSRLETAEEAGVSHVLEHADFRAIDWKMYKAIDKNASTNKLFIEHQSYMLLDPMAGHIDLELHFQKATMMGDNLALITDEALVKEVNNVKDEGLFNGQYGARARNMIMKVEELLLPTVWEGGSVHPTIGMDRGQHIKISKASDLLHLHHVLRGPSRTTIVLAGPIDTNAALNAVASVFSDVPDNRASLRPLPTTKAPVPGIHVGNVSTNGGTRGIAIGFVVPPYGPHSEVLTVIQQLTGMLGSQPAVEHGGGLTDVSMYYIPDKEASVLTFLATVNNADPSEERALQRGKEALQQLVIDPIRNFSDSRVLQELLRQYRGMLSETTASGPQQLAALAIRGVLAAGKPSLAWHSEHLYRDDAITVARVRQVANEIFDGRHMAVVRSTERTGSVSVAQVPHMASAFHFMLVGRRVPTGGSRSFP